MVEGRVYTVGVYGGVHTSAHYVCVLVRVCV